MRSPRHGSARSEEGCAVIKRIVPWIACQLNAQWAGKHGLQVERLAKQRQREHVVTSNSFLEFELLKTRGAARERNRRYLQLRRERGEYLHALGEDRCQKWSHAELGEALRLHADATHLRWLGFNPGDVRDWHRLLAIAEGELRRRRAEKKCMFFLNNEELVQKAPESAVFYCELWACEPEQEDLLVTHFDGSKAEAVAHYREPEVHFKECKPRASYWVRLNMHAPTWDSYGTQSPRRPVILSQRPLSYLPSSPSDDMDDNEEAHMLGMGLGIEAWNDARGMGVEEES